MFKVLFTYSWIKQYFVIFSCTRYKNSIRQIFYKILESNCKRNVSTAYPTRKRNNNNILTHLQLIPAGNESFRKIQLRVNTRDEYNRPSGSSIDFCTASSIKPMQYRKKISYSLISFEYVPIPVSFPFQ